MKRQPQIHTSLITQCISLALVSSLMAPMPSMAASISLANTPLATTTSSSVKPNLVLIMDNSGSMDWDHMPDDSSDGGSSVAFSFGYFALRSSQCNQVYYNPSITYDPPVRADGTSYPNATFTGAWDNGFNTGAGTTNLNTSFQASSSLNGDSVSQTAYYFSYTGSQTTSILKTYHDTASTFFKECKDSGGASSSARAPNYGVHLGTTGTSAAYPVLTSSTPADALFVKHRIAASNTTTIDITAPGTPTSTSVSSITVNGVELMNAASVGSTTASTVAANIVTMINARTAISGFSATASGSTVTITAPDASYKDYVPNITVASGNLTLVPNVFPDTSAASQTNFANWYSYYRTRMLMMKTATGQAFKDITDTYRVGLMKISSSTPVLNVGTFTDVSSTQRTDWYNALYNMTTSGSTPLRTALSNAGRYFAAKLSGVTDPMQYSCQQNFAILSTDGYWNSGDGYQMDGSTIMGNEDGTAAAPMWDGLTATGTTVTTTYTRDSYTVQSAKISGGSNCSGGKVRLIVNHQTQTCTVNTPTGGTAGPESCTTWVTTSRDYVSPYTSSSTTCVTSISTPPATARVATGSVTSTTGSGGSSNSLADVAMYYYQRDLRTSALSNCTGSAGVDVCDNNVFISTNDNNTQQHMTTFTLGLGASGKMVYSPSYLTDTTGDFFAVAQKSTASSTVCTWQTAGTVCTWPVPGMSGSDGLITNIDDLWHAAVNGHGAYFSATDPTTLSAGLANALSGIKARRGAAAAAATSTLNPVAGNNYAYVASYTTVAWKGNLEARGINTDTGAVSENASWCVENVVATNCPTPSTIQSESTGDTTIYYCVTPNSVICNGGTLVGTDCKVPVATACTGTMNSKVSDISDTRTIVTANSTGNGLTNFDAAYATANSAHFNASKQASLSQWVSLTAAQQANATSTNLINYLRGQRGFEDRTSNATDNRIYRFREAVLGDALESQPAFISKPVFTYIYPGYAAYAAAQAGRAGTVYMGANDGMMHAFDGATGNERWAYVPSMVVPNMWLLADSNYDTKHINYVNGSAITSDVCVSSCTDAATAVWKTILVGGLNAGGRGYYALDITDPASPALLWEFTTMSGVGAQTGYDDDDVGYSYGPASITRKADGTWVVVVTSGYNNTSPGNGQSYLYVLNAATGAIISKIGTGVGTTTTPSGLSKITVWNDEPGGNLAGYVYGGDLQGNLWRFDINSSTPVTAGTGNGLVMKFAELYSDTAGTQRQPITTAPVLGEVNGKRMIFIGTGKYLESSDLTNTQQQTQYGIIDDNAMSTLINPRNSLVRQTLTNDVATATRHSSSYAVNLSTTRGWFIDFPDSKERVNIDAKLVLGTLLIPSIVPSSTACSPGGYGWFNFVNYQTGGALSSGASAQKYDATIVGVNVIYVHGRPIPLVVTSFNPTPEQPDVPIDFDLKSAGFVGNRSIWRELVP